MATPPHHHKSAPRSFFSVNLWRSIGRRLPGSVVAHNLSKSDVDIRSQFSLSCDPHAQPGPLSGDTVSARDDPNSSVSLPDPVQYLTELKDAAQKLSASTDSRRHKARSRPLSWFATSRSGLHRTSAKSPTFPLPQVNSMSSVSKSSISTPCLTSTTNARVADAENIHHNDELLPDYMIDGAVRRGGPKSKGKTHDQCQDDEKLQKQQNARTSPWAVTVRSVRKKLNHTRRASMSLLFDKPRHRRADEGNRHLIVPPVVPTWSVSSLNLNQGQTGHSPAREYNSSNAWGFDDGSHPLFDKQRSAVRSSDRLTSCSSDPLHLPYLPTRSTTDLLFSWFSEAFANAVEDLVPSASLIAKSESSTTPKLRSARSYFSLCKVRGGSSTSTPDVNGGNEEQQATGTHATGRRNKTGQRSLDVLTVLSKSLNRQAQQPGTVSSKPVPLRFSGRRNRYVLAEPDTRSPDGVNPLRMHPEVTVFARPSLQTRTSVTPGHGSSRGGSDDDGSEDIECAIIYSPSTGNLSEYSRQTPSPAPPNAQVCKTRGPHETPTHKPLHRRSRSVLKRSVSTLFEKSASMMRLGGLTPSKRSRYEPEPKTSVKHTSWPELRGTADTHLSITKMRERAVSTPNLYGPDGLRAVWDYQPSTPSPLRRTTKLRSAAQGRQRAVTTTTPVRVPIEGLILSGSRKVATCADPEKRYGRLISPTAVAHTIC